MKTPAFTAALNYEIEWEVLQIEEYLTDGRIIAAVASTDGESFGILIERKGMEIVAWIERDPEGNGPGHIALQETSTP